MVLAKPKLEMRIRPFVLRVECRRSAALSGTDERSTRYSIGESSKVTRAMSFVEPFSTH